MKISPKSVVTLSYRLENDKKELVDEASREQPFAFIHGIGQTLPEFDKNLEGLASGESFAFSLTAEEAYGTYNDELKVDIPRANFEGAPEGSLVVGKTLPMDDGQGNPLLGLVTEVTDLSVRMDFNHPLAGENLHFSGEIIDIREATESELDHGHVHGPGGHHH